MVKSIRCEAMSDPLQRTTKVGVLVTAGSGATALTGGVASMVFVQRFVRIGAFASKTIEARLPSCWPVVRYRADARVIAYPRQRWGSVRREETKRWIGGRSAGVRIDRAQSPRENPRRGIQACVHLHHEGGRGPEVDGRQVRRRARRGREEMVAKANGPERHGRQVVLRRIERVGDDDVRGRRRRRGDVVLEVDGIWTRAVTADVLVEPGADRPHLFIGIVRGNPDTFSGEWLSCEMAPAQPRDRVGCDLERAFDLLHDGQWRYDRFHALGQRGHRGEMVPPKIGPWTRSAPRRRRARCRGLRWAPVMTALR